MHELWEERNWVLLRVRLEALEMSTVWIPNRSGDMSVNVEGQVKPKKGR